MAIQNGGKSHHWYPPPPRKWTNVDPKKRDHPKRDIQFSGGHASFQGGKCIIVRILSVEMRSLKRSGLTYYHMYFGCIRYQTGKENHHTKHSVKKSPLKRSLKQGQGRFKVVTKGFMWYLKSILGKYQTWKTQVSVSSCEKSPWVDITKFNQICTRCTSGHLFSTRKASPCC